MSTALSKSSLQRALDDLDANIRAAEERLERVGCESLAIDLRASFESALAEVRALPSSTRPIEQAELKLATAAATAGDLLAKIATDAGPGEAAIHGRFRQPLLKLLRELADGHDANAPDNWRDVLHNGIGGEPPAFSQSELGADAAKWAEAFVKTVYHRGCRHTHDVGFMLGWFANAIEYGHQAKLESQKVARPELPSDVATADVDYLDSGMKVGERGTPYTIMEAMNALANSPAPLESYWRELMQFLVRRVNRLEAERVKDLNVMTVQGQEIERLRSTTRRGIDVDARKEIAALKEYADLTVRRYQRLRVLGVAPSGTTQLAQGTVLRFQNLDDFVDKDLRDYPHRGEVDSGALATAGGVKALGRHEKLWDTISTAEPETADDKDRVRAEIVFDARDKSVEAHETSQFAQNLILQADDAMNRAIMALRLEVPESIANEIAKRYQAVYQAFVRRASQPSHELVSLRHFHENVTERLRSIRQLDSATKRALGLARLEDDVLANSGQALMKPRQLDAITVGVTGDGKRSEATFTEVPVTKRADGAYTVGPPPGGKTVDQRLDELTGNPLPRATEPANQCRHVDDVRGDRCILSLGHEGNSTERGVHVFGTPHYDRYTQPVIEAAKRVVALRLDWKVPGAEISPHDVREMEKLTDIVHRLNVARSKGDHQ